VGRLTLIIFRPLLRHSIGRDAYVLRVVGDSLGPVLREDHRRQQLPINGPDRRRSRAVP
jgi:hypothetical protein